MKTKNPLLLLLLITSFQMSQAATFNFTQDGFAEGATVTMSFTGEDMNADTQITSFDAEITDFNMSFSGNSTVAAFNLGFADLSGLVYDTDGGPLGDGLLLGVEGVAADDGSFFYSAGPGPFDECGVGIDCAVVSDGINSDFSQSLLVPFGNEPMAVPTLSQWSLLLLALLFVAFSFRNKALLAIRK